MVCAKQLPPAKHILRGSMLVRARVRSHLVALMERFEPIASCNIMVDAGTDYRYRIIIRKKTWTAIATELANEIDYNNFKNSVRDHDLHRALMDVWQRMYRMQMEEEPDDG